METVSFRQMKDGTREDYEFLADLEQKFIDELPDRILQALRGLDATLSGYQVTRLEHSLQAAARAEADGADEEMIVGTLIHDLGDDLAPENHSRYASTIIQPYVRPEVTWVVRHHGLFQTYFYAHHFGDDPNARDIYKDHPYYESCVKFCRDWDQAAFDPDYPTPSLEYYESMVRRVFSREPWQYEGSNTINSERAET